ncbi:MAG: hypothetical protein JXQ73_09805, partial [Phycisphaerae bacterium]|nr:hypothetical protein [Phycisphaerae bacterium]
GLLGESAFDNIEARTGVFDPDPVHLDLSIINSQYGTVTIDPDLADPNDPNTANDRLLRYTTGTEVVLVAEPVPSKSFNRWLVFDPNYPGDANYAAVEDSNLVLYLTMDEDKSVEASFKCGSSLPPLMLGGMLLALCTAVLIRRVV